MKCVEENTTICTVDDLLMTGGTGEETPLFQARCLFQLLKDRFWWCFPHCRSPVSIALSWLELSLCAFSFLPVFMTDDLALCHYVHKIANITITKSQITDNIPQSVNNKRKELTFT